MNSLNNIIVFLIVYAFGKDDTSIHNDLKIISNIQTDRPTDPLSRERGRCQNETFYGNGRGIDLLFLSCLF